MPSRDPWDEIERAMRGDYDDEDAMAGNSKPGSQINPVVAAIIAGMVTGAFLFCLNWFFGDSRTLAAIPPQLTIMQRQIELLTARPYISRDEFERELSRLDRRIDEGRRDWELKLQESSRRK